MKVAIAGGTGFIGKHLIRYYIQQKVSVVVISRKKQKSEHSLVRVITWSDLETNLGPLEGVDAIINLTGETISQRWTTAAKQRILQSRLDGVSRIRDLMERMEKKPVLINASGVAIYGTNDTENFIEESEWKKDDFLSGVVDEWESAAEQIPDARVVLLRFGIVLGPGGGAFPKMVTPIRLGLGGRIGSGKQPISWIHIEDLCRLIEFCIEQEEIEGPVNATAPIPVTNDEFGRQVAKRLNRPFFFALPAFVVKLMFGEMSMLLLKGQRVLPQAALKAGFGFKYPALELALEQLLPGKQRAES